MTAADHARKTGRLPDISGFSFLRMRFSPLNGPICTRRVVEKLPLDSIGFGTFLAASTSHRPLAATSSPDHGSRVSET